MTSTQYPSDEIVQRGQRLYNERIRAQVEPGNRGKFLIINVETGEDEMDADDLAASRRAKVRFPDAALFTMRVGFPAAYRLGNYLRGKRRARRSPCLATAR
jgi:hypothetical protein